MAELEKVIKGLECCLNTGNFEECTENCPYFTKEHGVRVCSENMQRDALSLLKAQVPILIADIAEAIIGCKPKVKVGHCPSCGVLMSETDRYCRKCGQAVKWE